MALPNRRGFSELSPAQYQQTLVAEFVPLADELRDMLTSFGMRPYTVHLVRIHWSGRERYEGTATVIADDPILPTPKLTSLDALAEVLHVIGLDEHGSVQVSQISGSYTEDDLRGQGAGGEPVAATDEFFYEIMFPRPDGLPGERRRFSLSGTPIYDAGRLQWTVRLEKADQDRTRDGSPR